MTTGRRRAIDRAGVDGYDQRHRHRTPVAAMPRLAVLVLLACAAPAAAEAPKLVVQGPNLAGPAVLLDDGRHLLATGGVGATLWDLEARRVVRRWGAPNPRLSARGVVLGYVHPPNGDTGTKYTVVRDLAAGREPVAIGPDERCNGLFDLSGDGRFVVQEAVPAAGSDLRRLSVWEADSGKLVRRFDIPPAFARAEAVAISGDGQRVASFHPKPGLVVWDATAGKELRTCPSEAVTKVVLSADGGRAATRTAKGCDIWDAVAGKLLGHVPHKTLWEVAFAPDGNSLALTSHHLVALYTPAGKLIRAIPTDGRVVGWTKAGAPIIYHVAAPPAPAFDADGKALPAPPPPADAEKWRPLVSGNSQEGKSLQTHWLSGRLTTWNLATGVPFFSAARPDNLESRLAPAATGDSRLFVSATPAGDALRVVGCDEHLTLTTTDHPVEGLWGFAVARDAGRVVVADAKGVRVWDCRADKDVCRLADAPAKPAVLQTDAAANYVLLGEGAGKVPGVWDARTGKKLVRLDGPKEAGPVASAQLPRPHRPGPPQVGSGGKAVSRRRLGRGHRAVPRRPRDEAPLHGLPTPDHRHRGGRVVVPHRHGPPGGGRLRRDHRQGVAPPGEDGLVGRLRLPGAEDRDDLPVHGRRGRPRPRPQGPRSLPPVRPRRGRCRERHAGAVRQPGPRPAPGRLRHRRLRHLGSGPEGRVVPPVLLHRRVVGRRRCGRPVRLRQPRRLRVRHLRESALGGRQRSDRTVPLKDRFYEPGLLAKVLGYDPEPLRPVKGTVSDIKLHPDVKVSQPAKGDAKLSVTLTNRGGGLGRVVVLVNGKELTDDARPRGSDPDAKSLKVDLDLKGDPRLVPGMANQVEVVAYNADGYLSSRGAVREFDADGALAADPPTLWAVVAGVSDYKGDKIDLKYAAKDADDFAAGLRVGAERLFGADRVKLTVLTTTAKKAWPTREAIVQALRGLKEAKPGDVVVLYLAGHGVTHGDDGEFYYLTADASGQDMKDAAVRGAVAISSKELAELLKIVPAQKQVMILDTCAVRPAGREADGRAERVVVPDAGIGNAQGPDGRVRAGRLRRRRRQLRGRQVRPGAADARPALGHERRSLEGRRDRGRGEPVRVRGRQGAVHRPRHRRRAAAGGGHAEGGRQLPRRPGDGRRPGQDPAPGRPAGADEDEFAGRRPGPRRAGAGAGSWTRRCGRRRAGGGTRRSCSWTGRTWPTATS